MRSTLDLGAAVVLGGALFAGAANAQCPPVGSDTGCGFIITVTDTRTTIAATGQGPYDDSDDTLIGVVNNSSFPITSLELVSSNAIFSFEGDGVDTFIAVSNARDNTGYGGPNTYFTNISADQTGGRTNFITPIAPGGGTTFFSLEGDLTGSPCTSILMNSVPRPANTTNGADIVTMFTPQGNDPSTGQPWTLAAAAQACGFFAWDWQQTITALPQPTPGSLFHENHSPNDVSIPTNDPPPQGWVYQTPCPPNSCDVPGIAVYWDPFPTHTNAGPYALAAEVMGNQLLFGDAPGDMCLPTGPQSAAVAAKADQSKANSGCGGPGVRAPAGSVIKFTTHLVGLQGSLSNVAIVDTGVGFDWTASFNGTVGGNSVLVSTGSPDPGSGTGGNTVTNFNATPTYNGVGITAVNGSPSGPSALLAAVLPTSRSVQVNNPATVFATIINTSTTTASACSIAPIGGLPLTSLYQTTSPATNALTGTANTPVDIPAGGSQSFVIALTPSATIAPTNVQFSFACSNANPAPIDIGLTTLLLSGSASLTPDVVALAATATNDGILHVPGASGTGAFATATVNVGTGGTITASTNTGSATLPLALTICQSNPANGQCLAPPAASVTTTINANATPTFSIFGTASGAIPFDPANSRVFVTFSDSSNAVRGETSVAVRTQ